MGPLRDAVFTLLSITALVGWLVVDHELWDRPRDEIARQQARLFNLVTVITLFIGITCLYATLFVLAHVTAAFLLTPESLGPLVGHQPDAGCYLSLARFIPSRGTVGGALGAR
ncbi:hypothetical protein ACWDA7_34605 [Streptomyces sp. NPDC001156]